MKKILKKNQVIITALAIMIAVAGYLNFTQDKADKMTANNEGSVETGAEAGEKTGDNTVLSEEELAALQDTEELTESADGQDESAGLDISAEDTGEDEVAVADNGEVAAKDGEENNVGDAVLVNNTIGADFFASARLSREQTRAKNKEILMELVENTNTTEQQKENAINEIIGMTSAAEKENAAETMLTARGFSGTVVSIIDGNVDVIVNANNLTDQQIAQIEDVVKRNTDITAENIVITPVGVEE